MKLKLSILVGLFLFSSDLLAWYTDGGVIYCPFFIFCDSSRDEYHKCEPFPKDEHFAYKYGSYHNPYSPNGGEMGTFLFLAVEFSRNDMHFNPVECLYYDGNVGAVSRTIKLVTTGYDKNQKRFEVEPDKETASYPYPEEGWNSPRVKMYQPPVCWPNPGTAGNRLPTECPLRKILL